MEEYGVGFFTVSGSWPDGEVQLGVEPDGRGGSTILSTLETETASQCYWRKFNLDRTASSSHPKSLSTRRKTGYASSTISAAGLRGSVLTWSFDLLHDARNEWLTQQHQRRVDRLENQLGRAEELREEALRIQQTEPNRSNRLMRRALRLDERRSRISRMKWRIARLDRVYARRLARNVSDFARQCWDGASATHTI